MSTTETGCTHIWDWRKYGSCPMCADRSSAAKTDQLDALPESVRSAFRDMEKAFAWGMSVAPTTWHVLRDELMRMAPYEQAVCRLAIEKAEQRQRAEKAEARVRELERERWDVVATRNAAIKRAERAEAELAAIKKRIAEAPILLARVVVPHACDGAPYIECSDLANGGLAADVIKPFLSPQLLRVRLLPLDDEAKS